MELNLKTQQNKLISLFRVSLMFFLFFFVQQTVASASVSFKDLLLTEALTCLFRLMTDSS